jgi:long-chain acyl-CoA synthetase
MLLKANYDRRPDTVWMRKKQYGIWQEYTWKQGYAAVKYLSLGLVSLGYKQGEMLAILGDNDPHWFWAELAAQSVNGIVTGIAAGCSSDEARYAIQDSGSRIVVAQDQEQVDKLLSIKSELSGVNRVIYWDHKGMKNYADPILMSFDEVSRMGQQCEANTPGLFERNIAQGREDDDALVLYDSATAGCSKKSTMTYRSIFAINEAFCKLDKTDTLKEWVSLNLPGGLEEQCLGLLGSLDMGLRMNFPEGVDTVEEDFREIGPSLAFYPTKVWERLAMTTQDRMRKAGMLTRLVYWLCLRAGYRVADLRLQGEGLNLYWRTLDTLCNLLMFKALRDKLGLLRIKVAYSGQEALAPEVIRFLRAIGVDLRESFAPNASGMSSAMDFRSRSGKGSESNC